jgi:hypothetical protein
LPSSSRTNPYNPQYIVTFEIDHDKRADCEITVYLAAMQNGARIMEKRFDDYYSRGGDYPFPANIMVMDITEFAPYINSYDLFLEVYDINNNGTINAEIVSFSVEKYSVYPGTMDALIDSTDTPVSISDNQKSYASIGTAGIIGTSLPMAAQSSSKISIESLVSARVISDADIERLKRSVGVYDKTKNYNRIINGHGTGLKPPTEEQWVEIQKSSLLVDSVKLVKAGASLPVSIDLSQLKHFPPIGNQGAEGCCVSFSVAYYIKTFQEALEHDWDFSATGWNSAPWPGEPDKDLDKIFSPDFIYHQINDGGDNGSYFHDNVHVITRMGAVSWLKFPYSDTDHTSWPGEAAWSEAPLYRGELPDTGTWGSYYMLEVDSWEKVNVIKTLLSNNIMVSIAVDADRYADLTADDIWNTDNYHNPVIDHANTIVGYVDD